MQQGHTVAIFARHSAAGASLEKRDQDGVQIWSAWNGRFQATTRFTATFHNPTLQNAFSHTLDQFQPEIVHVQHLMGLPTALLTELTRRHIPYIVTLHDFWWVCANAQLLTNDSQQICDGPHKFLNCARCTLARANRPLLKIAQPPLAIPLALRNRTLRHSLENAAQLITPTHFVKNWYAQHGLPPEKIAVIPPGLDYPTDLPADFSSSPQSPPHRSSFTEEKRPLHVGYIGGLSWQKGVHTLIQAFTQLPAPFQNNSQLWIAGDLTFDPDYVTTLQQAATPNVTFLGKLERPAIWQLLAQVDLIVIPSLWYETFCFVISEAHAMHVPVIASNIGALAERIQDQQNGRLFPVGNSNALQKILADLHTNRTHLTQLHSHIPHVPTFAEHVTAITAVYKQIIAG